MKNVCPVCRRSSVEIFMEIGQVPVYCNVLYPSREEALRVLRGDIHLGFCHHCYHVANLAFKPEVMAYTPAYENSLHFSARFQHYAETLARELVERYDLHDKRIVEIGSGKGEFLTLLCDLGGNRGVGFDPSYAPEPESPDSGSTLVTFVQAYYGEHHAEHKADLICCRHVLEHIEDPNQLLSTVQGAADRQPGVVVFFEVPNVLYTLRDLGIWDIIYEHCGYFSRHSLGYLFQQHGFALRDLSERYGGQFLTVEASLGGGSDRAPVGPAKEREQMARDVARFAEHYTDKVNSWRQRLQQWSQDRRRVVVWGAGSKGITFLNILDPGQQIDYVVDLNPRKQGMHIAGSGQPIVAPEFLIDYRPAVVVVMNPIYAEEIRRQLEEFHLAVDLVLA